MTVSVHILLGFVISVNLYANPLCFYWVHRTRCHFILKTWAKLPGLRPWRPRPRAKMQTRHRFQMWKKEKFWKDIFHIYIYIHLWYVLCIHISYIIIYIRHTVTTLTRFYTHRTRTAIATQNPQILQKRKAWKFQANPEQPVLWYNWTSAIAIFKTFNCRSSFATISASSLNVTIRHTKILLLKKTHTSTWGRYGSQPWESAKK